MVGVSNADLEAGLPPCDVGFPRRCLCQPSGCLHFDAMSTVGNSRGNMRARMLTDIREKYFCSCESHHQLAGDVGALGTAQRSSATSN